MGSSAPRGSVGEVSPEDLGIGELFERVRDAVIVADARSGQMVLWNGMAETTFGYSAAEALDLRVEVLVPEHFKARHRAGMSHYAETGGGTHIDSHALLELPALRKDGEEVLIELSLSPLGPKHDTGGGGPYVLAIIRNVTERRRAEEEIRRLNEELEELVAERTARLVESQRRLKELVGRLVAAQEEERRRVAYEVHDRLTQLAIAAQFYLRAFAEEHAPPSAGDREKLNRALELVQRTVEESRDVIEHLRPAALDDLGLAVALRLRIEELRSEGWRVDYEEALEGERLPEEVETVLYRVAQEALVNARKHAGVNQARVSVERGPGKVRLEVRDPGRGFDPSSPSSPGRPGERVGLSSMRERVALLGGNFVIRSRPGEGTAVVAEIPLPRPRERSAGHGA